MQGQPADGPPLPWVVLGVGTSKRTRGLQAALAQAGRAPARIVEWRDWLAARTAVSSPLDDARPVPCRFKIEPPGDDPQVHLALLHLGCSRLGRAPCPAPEHGELLATDAWFAGFEEVLQVLSRQLAGRPHLQVFNAPRDIRLMTDKLACQQHLQQHGTPTPLLLGPVSDYGHLQALMGAHGLDRAYVKARYGSSAAGVIAYRRNRRGQEQASTSAQHVDGPGGRTRLFNVKRIRSYHRPTEIRAVIDAVAAQGAYAEAWVPKPRSGSGHYDLRVLTLGQRAAHRVARVGQRAMTNLHLDSQRADPAALLKPGQLALMERTAEHAATAFDGSRGIGFDLVVNGSDAHVLEANAFGDLLPGLLWQGGDPYAVALREDLAA
jgi:glutathione synthase/RimK-type ligase-like ATP-grasp enzyme